MDNYDLAELWIEADSEFYEAHEEEYEEILEFYENYA